MTDTVAVTVLIDTASIGVAVVASPVFVRRVP